MSESVGGAPEAILSEIEFSQAVNDVTHAHRHNDAVKSLVRHDSALRRQNDELAQAAETLAGAADALEVEHDEWIGWYEEMRLRAEAAESRVAVLEDDLLRCLEVRNLALEEAALSIQTGGDGQDFLDRSRMIRGWLHDAYDRHAEGERAHHLTDGPPVDDATRTLGDGRTPGASSGATSDPMAEASALGGTPAESAIPQRESGTPEAKEKP